MLKVFAALAALAVPSGLPIAALAQDEGGSEAPPPPPGRDARPQPPSAPPVRNWDEGPRIEPERDQRDRGERSRRVGGGRSEGGPGDRGRWSREDGSGGAPNPPPPPPGVAPPMGDQDRWHRGDEDRRDRGWAGRGGGRQDGDDDRDRDDTRDRRPPWDRDRDRNRLPDPDRYRDRDGGAWNGGRGPGQDRGAWDRDRDRDRGRDYGGFRHRWNQDQWRRDWSRNRGYDWWRNDRGFRGYSGFRFGFYFAPGYGYYAVPRDYWGRRWYPGEYLPAVFWRYRLDDWRTYGLGFPPPGTQWVAVDNHIYLIDSYDGYIIEVIFDAWRW